MGREVTLSRDEELLSRENRKLSEDIKLVKEWDKKNVDRPIEERTAVILSWVDKRMEMGLKPKEIQKVANVASDMLGSTTDRLAADKRNNLLNEWRNQQIIKAKDHNTAVAAAIVDGQARNILSQSKEEIRSWRNEVAEEIRLTKLPNKVSITNAVDAGIMRDSGQAATMQQIFNEERGIGGGGDSRTDTLEEAKLEPKAREEKTIPDINEDKKDSPELVPEKEKATPKASAPGLDEEKKEEDPDIAPERDVERPVDKIERAFYDREDSKLLNREDDHSIRNEIRALNGWNSACFDRSFEERKEIVSKWKDKNLARTSDRDERKEIIRSANKVLARPDEERRTQPSRSSALERIIKERDSLSERGYAALSARAQGLASVLREQGKGILSAGKGLLDDSRELIDSLRSREKDKDPRGLEETREIVRESVSRINLAIKDIRSNDISTDLKNAALRVNKAARDNPALQSFYNTVLNDTRTEAKLADVRSQAQKSIQAITDYEKFGLDRETLSNALRKKDANERLELQERAVLKDYNRLEREVKKIVKQVDKVGNTDSMRNQYSYETRSKEIMNLKERSNDEKNEERTAFVQNQREVLEEVRGKGLEISKDKSREILNEGREEFRKEYERVLSIRNAVERAIDNNIRNQDNRSEELARQHTEVNKYASDMIDRYKDMVEDYRSTIDTESLARAHDKLENRPDEMLLTDERAALTKERECNAFSAELDRAFNVMKFGDAREETIDRLNMLTSNKFNLSATLIREELEISKHSFAAMSERDVMLSSNIDRGLERRDRETAAGRTLSENERLEAAKKFEEKYREIGKETTPDRGAVLEYARSKVDFNQDPRFAEMLDGRERIIRSVKGYNSPAFISLSREKNERVLQNRNQAEVMRIGREHERDERRAEQALRPDEIRAARYMYKNGFMPKDESKLDKNVNDFDSRYFAYYNLMRQADKNKAEAKNELNNFRTERLKSSYDKIAESLESYSQEERDYFDSLRRIEDTDRLSLDSLAGERYVTYKEIKTSMQDIADRLDSYGNNERNWSALSRECDPKDSLSEQRLDDDYRFSVGLVEKVREEITKSYTENNDTALRESFTALKDALEKMPPSDKFEDSIRNGLLRKGLETRDYFNSDIEIGKDELDPRQLESRRVLEKALYDCYGSLEEKGLVRPSERQEMAKVQFVFDPRKDTNALNDELSREDLSPRLQYKMERENILRPISRNTADRDERSFFDRAKDYVFRKMDDLREIRDARAADRFAKKPFDRDEFGKLSAHAQQLYIMNTNSRENLLAISEMNRFADSDDPREQHINSILENVRSERSRELISRKESELEKAKQEAERINERIRALDKELVAMRQ